DADADRTFLRDVLEYRYSCSWPLLAVAGVTVARPFSRVLARLGARELVPRVPGRWQPSVACWFSGAAWSAALTTRSSGRARVTPFRRHAPKPWAHLPITVAPHVMSVSMSGTQILPERSDNYRSSTTDQQNRQLFSTRRSHPRGRSARGYCQSSASSSLR